MNELKVLALAGSFRTASYNRKLLQISKKFALAAGAEVEEIDLRELNLPVYDQDIEDKEFPASAQKLKDAIAVCDVLLIATPEYNHGVPGGLKNAIDWASRGKIKILRGKVAAIFGASTGQFGTVRAQLHLRQILSSEGVLILPVPTVLVANAASQFNPDGSLVDEKLAEKLKKLVEETLLFVGKLKN